MWLERVAEAKARAALAMAAAAEAVTVLEMVLVADDAAHAARTSVLSSIGRSATERQRHISEEKLWVIAQDDAAPRPPTEMRSGRNTCTLCPRPQER